MLTEIPNPSVSQSSDIPVISGYDLLAGEQGKLYKEKSMGSKDEEEALVPGLPFLNHALPC